MGRDHSQDRSGHGLLNNGNHGCLGVFAGKCPSFGQKWVILEEFFLSLCPSEILRQNSTLLCCFIGCIKRGGMQYDRNWNFPVVAEGQNESHGLIVYQVGSYGLSGAGTIYFFACEWVLDLCMVKFELVVLTILNNLP